MMQSQGVLGVERMCQATGVSRAGFYRRWEERAPDEAGMALRSVIQRASVEHLDTGRRRWQRSCRRRRLGGQRGARAAGAAGKTTYWQSGGVGSEL